MSARERRAAVRRFAEAHDGVLSRTLLRGMGISAQVVAREVAAERWAMHGSRTVAVHTGALGVDALWWRAVWEVGRGAVLDGVSALQASGLKHFDTDLVHVSVDHRTAGLLAVEGVQVHRVRDAMSADVRGSLPRVRPAVATVRAAQWAASDRQAALIVCMAVQQGLVRGADLVPVRWPGAHYGRTAFVRQLVADVTDGAHSLGELDFATACRERGLPAPDRQVVRHTPTGRIYLDAYWRRFRLSVEIDGAQHRQGLAVSDDNLRRNEVTLGDDRVLTIDLVGYRLMRDAFMTQVERALAAQSKRWAA